MNDNEAWLTVREILDDDYGCEVLPEGTEPLVTVFFTEPDGTERQMHLADCATRGWKPGDRIVCGADGSLSKADDETWRLSNECATQIP